MSNSSNPELSVIVTAYNVADYIDQAVQSVLDGTATLDCEIIIVDDGSTDGTRQRIESIAKAFPTLRVIQFEENTPGGVARAANAGMNAAKGQFIGFLDGDDIVLPHSFGHLLAGIKAENADIALCDYDGLHTPTGQLSASNDRAIWRAIARKKTYRGDEVESLLKLQTVPWRKLYRAGFLDSHALRFSEVDSFFEDTLFHWQVCLAAKSAVICDFSGFHYRRARPGQTIESAGKTRLKALNFAPQISALARKNGSQTCYDAFLNLFLGMLAWVGPLDRGSARDIQQDARNILSQYPARRIATMLRRTMAQKRLFSPEARAFAAVIWLKLRAPYMFRKRIERKRMTLFEALIVRAIILLSPR